LLRSRWWHLGDDASGPVRGSLRRDRLCSSPGVT
jgi:hypothetical protein